MPLLLLFTDKKIQTQRSEVTCPKLPLFFNLILWKQPLNHFVNNPSFINYFLPLYNSGAHRTWGSSCWVSVLHADTNYSCTRPEASGSLFAFKQILINQRLFCCNLHFPYNWNMAQKQKCCLSPWDVVIPGLKRNADYVRRSSCSLWRFLSCQCPGCGCDREPTKDKDLALENSTCLSSANGKESDSSAVKKSVLPQEGLLLGLLIFQHNLRFFPIQ